MTPDSMRTTDATGIVHNGAETEQYEYADDARACCDLVLASQTVEITVDNVDSTLWAGTGRRTSNCPHMTRHGGPAVLALALVLLGSLAQIVAARRVAPDARPRPTSATVVNIVAPAGVLFITAAVGYLRIAGGPHAASSRVTNVLIAAALFASAAYTTVVTLVALAVAVAHNGLRRVWPSVWVVTAASVTCVAFLPMVLHP